MRWDFFDPPGPFQNAKNVKRSNQVIPIPVLQSSRQVFDGWDVSKLR